MMENLASMAYVIAGVCFIFSLGGLSQHETARRGNWLGIVGMSLAIFATLLKLGTRLMSHGFESGGTLKVTVTIILLALALAIGAAIGIYLAIRVEMTAMPQLVAILHSFVGLAAVFVGFNSHANGHHDKLSPQEKQQAKVFSSLEGLTSKLTKEVKGAAKDAKVNLGDTGDGELNKRFDASAYSAKALVHKIEIFLGVFIGAITFTGSIIAWGKLQGVIGSKPLMIPGRHFINLAAILFCCVLGLIFVIVAHKGWALVPLIFCALIAFAIGAHLVMAIGGADMPVVVSMLNSYSGWAAAATGFMLDNDLLIVVGALVGSSGAILSYIMCAAMNRSFISVILGGFGVESGTVAKSDSGETLTYTETMALETADSLLNAREVIIVPGYGMAVAQAQNPVRDVMEILKERGTRCRFAIHPVAGRLPGHMNVLLAEAKVPYDVVLEMDEINEDFPDTDVVLVIGANDIVNPGALDDPSSPIYQMPVLHAWEASEVVILKRSMATGYSGIDNPLFYKENSRMLFGDAKTSIDNVLAEMRNRIG